MVIAINISPLFPGEGDGNNKYLGEITCRMALQHPEHTFVFIVPDDFQVTITGSNIKIIRTGVPPSNRLLREWWTAIRLPGLLKKCGAARLISAEYALLRTQLPQVLLLTDLYTGPVSRDGITKKQVSFYAKSMERYTDKAGKVVTFSETIKKDILSRYKTADGKLVVIPPFPDARFRPLDYEARQRVKEKHSGGKEYLLYNGPVHAGKNMLHLLKAFSLFKKKQKTGMKLMFTGSPAPSFTSFLKDLQTFRFRDDVLFTGSLTTEQRAEVTGSAYALVYPSAYEGMAQPVLEALQCGIPVICSPGSAAAEIAGNAVLSADPADINDTAEKIILLYKDENRRNGLIKDGLAVSDKYKLSIADDMLWNAVNG